MWLKKWEFFYSTKFYLYLNNYLLACFCWSHGTIRHPIQQSLASEMLIKMLVNIHKLATNFSLLEQHCVNPQILFYSSFFIPTKICLFKMETTDFLIHSCCNIIFWFAFFSWTVAIASPRSSLRTNNYLHELRAPCSLSHFLHDFWGYRWSTYCQDLHRPQNSLMEHRHRSWPKKTGEGWHEPVIK